MRICAVTAYPPSRAGIADWPGYPKRRDFEDNLDAVKTHQHGTRVVLRSRHRDVAEQDARGFLLVHLAIRLTACHPDAQSAG